MPIFFSEADRPVTVYLTDDVEPRTAFIIRPLTSAATERARLRAGVLPFRGLRLLDEGFAHREDWAGWMETLDEADLVMLARAQEWTHSTNLEVVREGLVTVDGEVVTADQLEAGIRPASCARVAIAELRGHIQAVSELDPKALSEYELRCGSNGTDADGDGTAPSA